MKVIMNNIDTILKKRRLNKGGPAQIFFTKECAKAMNNFIPLQTGRLKDMSIEIGVDFVAYTTPYARKQFYANAGNGKGGMNVGGQRGKRWDKRMWISKGSSIVKKTADYVGGRTKWKWLKE